MSTDSQTRGARKKFSSSPCDEFKQNETYLYVRSKLLYFLVYEMQDRGLVLFCVRAMTIIFLLHSPQYYTLICAYTVVFCVFSYVLNYTIVFVPRIVAGQ